LVAGEGERPELAAELRGLGAELEVAAAYRVQLRWPRVRWERFDLVVAPSSSGAQHLGASEAAFALGRVPWVAMGPRTEAAIAALGITRIARAEHDDLDALVAKVEEVARG
jgi:uroporphyrinogen-III synthase